MPSELRLYDVVVNGYPTRMRLDKTDAARLNASPVDGQDIGGDSPDATAAPDDEHPQRKARTKVPNRARAADDTK